MNLDYLYNPDYAKKYFGKDHFAFKTLGFRVIENGMILPHTNTGDDGKWTWLGVGGIVDGNGDYVKESFIHHGVGGAYTPDPESIQESSETVIYLGISFHIWGHCITDNIRRVWFFKSQFMNQFRKCPIVYISWAGRDLENQKNFRRLLEILGIDVDKVRQITQPTRFAKIILPDESFFVTNNRKFTGEYCETIDYIRDFALSHRTPSANKKIYYLHDKNQFGEERIAECFKDKGYEIIQPEKLTLDEQLNLLINAESFVSILGSSSHNSIFLRDGTESIFICRTANNFTVYQEALNQIRPMNSVTYIDSSLSLFGTYCYIISRQLKKFLGEEFDGYTEEDFKVFLEYVKTSLSKGLTIKPNIKEAYAEVLKEFLPQLKQHKELIATYNLPADWEKVLS